MLRWSSHARVRSAARDSTIYFRFYDKSSMFLEDLEKRCRSTRLLLQVIQSGLSVSKACAFFRTPCPHPPKSFCPLKSSFCYQKKPHSLIRMLGEEVEMTQKHQQRKYCFLPRFQCLSLKLVNFKHNLRQTNTSVFFKKKKLKGRKICFHLNKTTKIQGSYRSEGFVRSYFLQASLFKKIFFFSAKKGKTKIKYAHLGKNSRV